MELLDDVCHMESHSVCLEIVLILMQDRCTVCMGHTICLKIDLDAPDGTPSDVCYMESRFVRLETVLVSVQGKCTIYA